MAQEQKPRRRLPIIQSSPPDDESGEERPGWHWAVITAIATLLAWLLLAALANLALSYLFHEQPGIVARVAPFVLNAIVFAISAALGAFLTGRYGKKATRRHAIVGAVGTAVFGWALAFSGAARAGGLGVWLLTLLGMACLAALGATLGHARGARSVTPRA